MKKIIDAAKQWLTETGQPWRIDEGTKHFKLFLGDQLVGIIPKCSKSTANKRAQLNIRAQIRRAAKGLKP